MYVSVIDTNNLGQQAVLGRAEVPLSRLSATENGVEVVSIVSNFKLTNTSEIYISFKLVARLTLDCCPPTGFSLLLLPLPFHFLILVPRLPKKSHWGYLVLPLLALIKFLRRNNNNVGCTNTILLICKEYSRIWQVCFSGE